MPWAFKDLKSDLARLLNQDLGDLYGKAAELEVRKVIDQTDVQHEKSDKFHWELWLVAGSGFFTAGFSLVATNSFTIIFELPIIEPFFGPAPPSSLVINELAILGMLVGQISFGILSDVKGRTFAYGLELLLMIFGTIGMATSSVTFIPFWRLVLGVGVGAEHSLSALIVSEWSSTRWRSFSMVAVLLMNWIGQAVASLTAFAISQAFFPNALDLNVIANPAPTKDIHLNAGVSARDLTNTLDKAWRVAVLLSIVFPLMAIIFRPLLPETPLWAATHRNLDQTRRGRAVFSSTPARSDVEDLDDNTCEDITRIQRVKTFLKGLRTHLLDPHRLWAFVAISVAWFITEFIYSGIGLEVYHPTDVPQQTVLNETRVIEVIQPEVDQLGLYRVVNVVVYSMMYVSPLSIIGGLLASALVDRVYRVRWMGWCFFAFSALFLGLLVPVSVADVPTAFLVLDLIGAPLVAFLSNFGPNTVLFILGAELFGTEYRGTLYGFAAAIGKLGALVKQPVLVTIDNARVETTADVFLSREIELCFLSAASLIAALVTWAWIPETQVLEPRRRWLAVVPNRTLEDIAEDPCGAQQLGISRIWRRAFGLLPAKMRQTGDGNVEEGPGDEDQGQDGSHGNQDAITSRGLGADQELEISELTDGHQNPGWWLRGGEQRIQDESFGHHQDQDRVDQHRDTDNELPEVPERFELAFVPASVEHTWI